MKSLENEFNFKRGEMMEKENVDKYLCYMFVSCPCELGMLMLTHEKPKVEALTYEDVEKAYARTSHFTGIVNFGGDFNELEEWEKEYFDYEKHDSRKAYEFFEKVLEHFNTNMDDLCMATFGHPFGGSLQKNR